ncbi:MAG: cytochrome C, partial [Acidobacteriota bacterium]
MRKRNSVLWFGVFVLVAGMSAMAVRGGVSGWTLIGWNDLGMHCMDADYSVMAILPPYNTVHAQLIDPSGNLVEIPDGVTVTYEAVADPGGSVNTTSIGKSNFWDHVGSLFGVGLAADEGLAGFDMPGAGNAPQAMVWEAGHQWFTAEGVPITPFDDGFSKNFYPMMRLVARDGAGLVLATTDVVLPVSDEMDCRSCHASGSGPAAEPDSGWVWDGDAERDYRLNLLRLHDETDGGNPVFIDALAALSFDPGGLEATAVGGRSILCAACHSSNALPGTGVAGISPLTQAIHSLHAGVTDPDTGMA